MNWWEILEIPYDSDLKAIKKAYAKLLKIHNPEEDPEGYQKLREAYDKAIKDIKKNNKQNLHINLAENISYEPDIDEPNINDTIIKKQYQNINNNYEEQNDNNDINQKIEEFLDKLNKIYNDNSLKKNTEVWEELLNMDVVWNVYTSPIIEDYMFRFLIDHKNLPLNIWYILDYYFNWTKKERDLYEKYDFITIGEVFKVLQNISELKYEYVKQIDPNFIEKYLSLRIQGCEALKIRDYYEAQQCLLSAYEIFTHDAELLKLIGEFYYKIGDLDKSLEFYKLAFEINNSDLDVALWIGNILVIKISFAEALPYFELYLTTNSNDIVALNNIAYCYYFTGNLVKAKEFFKKALELQPKNRRLQKCIKTVEAELEGKNIKPLKLKKRNPHKKKVVKRRSKRRKAETSIKKSRIIAIIISTIMFLLYFKLAFFPKAPVNNNHSEKSIEYQDKNNTQNEIYDKDETVFKNIKTRDDFRSLEYYINLRIYLDKVIPTNYFKISEKFQGKIILSKTEIQTNNLQNKIESQLFIGIFDTGATLFTDKNYKEDTVNKNAKYKIEGAMCAVDKNILEDIKTKFKSHNESGKTWTNGLYIDCLPKEVERLRKHNESFEIHNGTRVRVSKTLKELKESNYEALHSIYLTNIMPLNVYVNVDKNGKFDFRKKEELNGKSFNNKIYAQAFVGQIDGKNVMFIDSNFSMNNVDSNRGYNAEGYTYKITIKEDIKLPTEKGQPVDSVIIDPCFLYNTNLKL
ncbi:tetratricopeptide repeat protein [Clostridium sp. MB40-C1]|uniref:J domain-containing protein n=1 Tax=Clostridium sp. MB40-C1 TaxID=3070996 RepID=UPI0027DFC474|nr:tetratricopeptide repeat protein [Clostridium sp. MB40-C1]WMJ81591.1 tetratricopeptide repeat protein [Clostridium sp. MB40-C1]